MTLININDITIYFDHKEDKAIINEVFFEDTYRVSEIPEKSTVLDIGAHIGTFAIRCAHERRCIVYAYEPSSRNFRLLVKNIELNHLRDKIKAFNQGVTKRSEMRTFYFRPTGPQSSSFFFHADTPYEEEIAQCITLKRVFEDNHILSCGTLKMDCEEAEKEIFTDEFSSYIKSVDYIIVEWHNYDGHIYAHYLEKLGFSVLLTGTGLPQPKYDPSFARGMLYAHKVS